MPMRLLVVVVVLGLAGFAPAPLPRVERKGSDGTSITLRQFQGLWRVEAFASSKSSGEHAKRDWHIKYIRITDDRWTFMNNETSENVSYSIDIGPNRPTPLDFHSYPRNSGESQARGVGIIRRQGERVFIIYVFGTPETRATNFEQPPENQWVIWLERVRR